VSAGDRAEERAVLALIDAGFLIVARNVKTRGGEIDVVAIDGNATCFIEVRLRDTLDRALDSVDANKKRRLIRAAERYMLKHGEVLCRFDVVLVTPTSLRIVKDAFRA
jgi:putative endonuclease